MVHVRVLQGYGDDDVAHRSEPHQRTNLETCITVHMHQKESTEDLVRKKVIATILPHLLRNPSCMAAHYFRASIHRLMMVTCLFSSCRSVIPQILSG